MGTRAPGNPGFLHASWSQGSWQGPGFLALVLSRLMGLWRCSSSSAKQANPKVTASAQRIALHFSSIQMNSVRVYCTPFITATWGSRGCKTPFLPSGSLSTGFPHKPPTARQDFPGKQILPSGFYQKSPSAVRSPPESPSALRILTETPSALRIPTESPSALRIRLETPSALRIRTETPSALRIRTEPPSALRIPPEIPFCPQNSPWKPLMPSGFHQKPPSAVKNPPEPAFCPQASPRNLFCPQISPETPFYPQDSTRNALLPSGFPWEPPLSVRNPPKPPSAGGEFPGNHFLPSGFPHPEHRYAPQDSPGYLLPSALRIPWGKPPSVLGQYPRHHLPLLGNPLETICLWGIPLKTPFYSQAIPGNHPLLVGNPPVNQPPSVGGEFPENPLLPSGFLQKLSSAPQISPKKTLFFQWGIPQIPPSADGESPRNPLLPLRNPLETHSAPWQSLRNSLLPLRIWDFLGIPLFSVKIPQKQLSVRIPS